MGSDYNLEEFVRDYEFTEAAKRYPLYYRPKRGSWDLEQIELMRGLIREHVYGALYGSLGEPISIDECEPERVVAAFKDIYARRKVKTQRFQRSVEETLGPELGKHVLARAVARDKGKAKLETHYQECIDDLLKKMGSKAKKSALEYITSIGEL